ncbi:MAG: tRNA pseudouridine(54/55) synthase Pus10 [Candidatus Bathyarchaeota archaeon]|nr:MAG: tRNA pseudouridine(54/55) synthase Pus10 [Candidatus Bathyarchaeota archaeon]
MRILEKAQRMLEKYSLCNHCLGRQFALLGYGLDDEKRGDVMKTLLTMKANKLALMGERGGFLLLRTLVTNGSFDMAAEVLTKMMKTVGKKLGCHLCEGRFEQLPALVSSAVEKLADYDYATFLVGINLPSRVEEKEDEFKAEFEVKHGEGMRNGFSREIGKEISRIVEKTVEYRTPDVVVIVNPFSDEVTLQVNPLYIAGRYRKLVRGIPQSRWFCPNCRGKGCGECNWTGKMYSESVEEIISAPLLEESDGEETALHAAGREDVDVRMLGRGRPFVVEIKKPKRRLVDLQDLTKAINQQAEAKVKVLSLRFADKEAVRRLKKREGASKMYNVVIESNRVVSDEELRILEQTLTNTIIRQQTPLRVLHRRADRVREKYIYEAKTKRLKPNRMEMRIHCQGGLYVKELITGDEGRTNPNVSELIGVKAEPISLDVLEIIPRED